MTALSSTPAFSVSVGSVYAGQYSGVGKFPIRMVANSAGTFTITRYGGPVVGTWVFAGAGEQWDVLDGPSSSANWTLVKSTGGTHVLSTNSPYRMTINNIQMISGTSYTLTNQVLAGNQASFQASVDIQPAGTQYFLRWHFLSSTSAWTGPFSVSTATWNAAIPSNATHTLSGLLTVEASFETNGRICGSTVTNTFSPLRCRFYLTQRVLVTRFLVMFEPLKYHIVSLHLQVYIYIL